jgi:hypothetical protein
MERNGGGGVSAVVVEAVGDRRQNPAVIVQGRAACGR